MASSESTDGETKPRLNYLKILIALIVTPITAVALSYYGYIPYDPLTAAISGIIVGIVYVFFRLCAGTGDYQRAKS